jgi:hypothetical protein
MRRSRSRTPSRRSRFRRRPDCRRSSISFARYRSDRRKQSRRSRTNSRCALSKLNDVDLSQFQRNVTQALKDAKGNTDELKTALGAALQEELLRLGLTAEQAGAQFTEAGKKIIATFSDIVNNAQVSGKQIQLAFAKALSQAATEGEVEALRRSLKDAFDAGKIGLPEFQEAIQASGRKLTEIEVNAAKAGAALDGMGKQGQTAAQHISNALQETRDKLIVQSNQIAAAITAALQSGDKAAAASLNAQFKGLDSQIQSLNQQIETLTPKWQTAGDAGEHAGRRTVEAVKSVADATDEATKKIHEYGDDGGASLAQLDEALGNTRASFLSVSDAAAKAFDTRFEGDFKNALDSAGNGALGFSRVIIAMNQAAADTNAEIAAQREQLKGEIASLNDVGTESVRSLQQVRRRGAVYKSASAGNDRFDQGRHLQRRLARAAGLRPSALCIGGGEGARRCARRSHEASDATAHRLGPAVAG